MPEKKEAAEGAEKKEAPQKKGGVRLPKGVVEAVKRLEFDFDPRDLIDWAVREAHVSIILSDYRKVTFTLDELGLSFKVAEREVEVK